MKKKLFKGSIVFVAAVFVFFFCTLVIPPLIDNPDIIGAFAAGFTNPFASGYSIDVICCWVILTIWIAYEYPRVKYGWLCILLGLIPGVAVGFALYLFLRTYHLTEK